MKLAHGETIIHRDIKPDNIIVNDAESDSLYLVDYGLSFNSEDTDATEVSETFKSKKSSSTPVSPPLLPNMS